MRPGCYYRRHKQSSAKLPANGITVGYEDHGEGRPLVLVHGHPFNRSMWQPHAEHFRRSGWRVIVPDLRGYGDTTVVPGKPTLETFARDIAALLDQRRGRPPAPPWLTGKVTVDGEEAAVGSAVTRGVIPGCNPGIKLSATRPNSEQLKRL